MSAHLAKLGENQSGHKNFRLILILNKLQILKP
jgi:hypothetical protein